MDNSAIPENNNTKEELEANKKLNDVKDFVVEHADKSKSVSMSDTGGGCSCKSSNMNNTGGGCSCKSSMDEVREPTYVYTIGRINYTYPSESIRLEFFEAFRRAGIALNVEEGDAVRILLTAEENRREYRYLARQLCWVYTVGRVETYILIITDPLDLDTLIDTITDPTRRVTNLLSENPYIDLIVGVKGPIAPPGKCGTLILPTVYLDQVASYRVEDVKKAIKEHERFPTGEERTNWENTIDKDVFPRLIEAATNEGIPDETRAVNFLVFRYVDIYIESALLANPPPPVRGQPPAISYDLESVIPKPARQYGMRKVVEVIFHFRSRQAGGYTKMFVVRVDVSGEFPHLASGWTPYYEPLF
jgi:hypothetical protein